MNYSSLRKPSTGFEPLKRKLPQYFFVNPNNLNSPSFFLKKAQIILHKKTASVAPASSVLNDRRFFASKTQVLENEGVFEEWLSLPDSESEEGSYGSSFEEEKEEHAEQFDETTTHISSTQINSKILEDLVVNIKFILNNRQVFYKSVLYFDTSEVLDLWTRKDLRIRKFTVLLSSLLISHKSLKTEFISKSELNLAPGKIILNPLSSVKSRIADFFRQSLETFLGTIFEDRMDQEILHSMVTVSAHLLNSYKVNPQKPKKTAEEIRGKVDSLISKFSDSNCVNSESPFGNSQDGSKYSSKDSLYREQSELNKLISVLAKCLLSLLNFDNEFFSKVTFLLVKRISQFPLNVADMHENRQREFDQYLNSSENLNLSDLESVSKVSFLKDEIVDSSLGDILGEGEFGQKRQNFYKTPKNLKISKLDWGSKSPENSSPKNKKKNEIFWYFNFVSFSKKIFDMIFSKMINVVSVLRKDTKYLPKGLRCLRKMEKKLGLYSRQYCKKEALFSAVLREKLSRAVKVKAKIFKLLRVEKYIHRTDVKYMYEEDLRFDINFEPQVDMIPDCAENLIGFEIKPWQLRTLSKMRKLSRPRAEDSEYMSGRLRDYLSMDQSHNFGDTYNTNGKLLMAIKENDGEDKFAGQDFGKESTMKKMSQPKKGDVLSTSDMKGEEKEFELFDFENGKEGKVIIRRSKLEIFDSKFNVHNEEEKEEDRKMAKNYEMGYRNLDIKESDVLNECIASNRNQKIQFDLLSDEEVPGKV